MRLTILVLGETIKALASERYTSFPHGLANAPANILTDGFALCLRKGTQKCDKHFAFTVQSVDIFLLENHCDAQLFQCPDIVKAIHCVAGEAGDGLYQYEIDLPFPAQANHPKKLRPLFSRGTCDSLIREYPGHTPLGILHNFIGIVRFLGFVTGHLFL